MGGGGEGGQKREGEGEGGNMRGDPQGVSWNCLLILKTALLIPPIIKK